MNSFKFLAISVAVLLLRFVASGAETNTSLSEARAHFTTKLVKRGPAPHSPSAEEYRAEKCPVGVREAVYPSGKLKLKAWVSEKSNEAKKPGVLFLHGGSGFGGADWQDAKAFQTAGFVLMVPMLRGENGNPGEFEMFYSEVDDVIAAGRYLKSLPYVDSNNVFVAGYSVGGTLTQLAAMMTDEFRGAASFSGAPDLAAFAKDWGWTQDVPFDKTRVEEYRIRSSLEFPGSVKCPLFLCAGQKEVAFVQQNGLLATKAQKLGKPVTFTAIPGDHFTALNAEINTTIKNFQTLMAMPMEKPASSR